MRWIMATLLVVLVSADMFALDLSLAPGVSIKNAGIYLMVAVLILRMALTGQWQLENRGALVVPFAVLIGYAVLTLVLNLFVIQPPDYPARDAVIKLKATFLDHATFFLAFFYALANRQEAISLLKVLTGGIAVANVATIMAVLGWVSLPGLQEGTSGVEEGRVFGVFGHANETAAVIVAVLPFLLAFTLQSRALPRVLWGAGFLLSAAVLVMTASRGAFAGLIVGSFIAMLLCRQYVPIGRAMMVAAGVAATSIALLAVLNPDSLDLLLHRVLSQSMSTDIGEASSGRTDIWGAAIDVMMTEPLTLITGYGWYMYETLPFRFAPHNYYLWLWFNLGLVGVVTFLFMLQRVIGMARRAIPRVDPVIRSYLVAFVFGLSGYAVTIFFSNIYQTWIYTWVVIGIMMRLTLFVMDEHRVPEVQRKPLGSVPAQRRLTGSRVGEIRRHAS